MLPAYLNIRDVDKRAREDVIRLNELPYVVTTSSCEGHLLPDIDVNAEGSIIWKLTNSRGHPVLGIGMQTDGSSKSIYFVERLKRFCSRYEFVNFEQVEADNKEEIDERLKAAGCGEGVYGFKFPLGKEAYSMKVRSVSGNKESVTAYKRDVNRFWAELAAEVMAYETLF